jgi:hypothetical protein
VVCSRYASRAPVIQGSLVNFLSPARGVGLFSACVPPVPSVRSGSKEVWKQRTRSRNVLRALMAGGSTETEVRALMKVLIGVDPHKRRR